MNRMALILFGVATVAAVGLTASGTGRQFAPVRVFTVPAGGIPFGSAGSVRSGSVGNSNSSYHYGK